MEHVAILLLKVVSGRRSLPMWIRASALNHKQLIMFSHVRRQAFHQICLLTDYYKPKQRHTSYIDLPTRYLLILSGLNHLNSIICTYFNKNTQFCKLSRSVDKVKEPIRSREMDSRMRRSDKFFLGEEFEDISFFKNLIKSVSKV